MDYYKIEVHLKEGAKYNPLHGKINGKRCRNRTHLLDDDSIIMEIDFGNEDWHTIRTSTVLDVYEIENDVYLIETKNTRYILTPINEEEEKNEI